MIKTNDNYLFAASIAVITKPALVGEVYYNNYSYF